MRIPRIYQAGELATEDDCEIKGQQAHHLLKVLRCRSGDPVTLFNGDGSNYAGIILSTSRNSLRVRIGTRSDPQNESPLMIHLGIPLAKGQRMDYAIQKAVELGVAGITPLTTTRTVVKLDSKRLEGKYEHWRQVIIAACEQCGRARVPPLSPVQALEAWARTARFGIMLDPGEACSLSELESAAMDVHLVAGPEGGLTTGETAMLRERGFHAVTLGPRVLRTETAPVAALAALQLLWGDF
ncbi:MAG: 16S rRNA (uracil(1498)-N(3))-methyltransferase [Chromatiales bacterium]|jgi:16S rRNA (uracil1498-N3)-methyltransferase